MKTQATQELSNRLIELYGTDDYTTVVGMWQSNPSSVPIDGSWGIAHAAGTLLQLQTRNLLGDSDTELISLANEQVARWYSREAISRCYDNITDWLNPLNWSEDSRLDYMTPLLFVEWYVTQL